MRVSEMDEHRIGHVWKWALGWSRFDCWCDGRKMDEVTERQKNG